MDSFKFSYESVPTDAMVKLRLDVLPKSRLFLTYLAAFSAFALCFGLAFLAPRMFDNHEGAVYQCEKMPDYRPDECFAGDAKENYIPLWIGRMQNVTPFNQFFVITADVYRSLDLASTSTLSVSFELVLEVSLRAVFSEDSSTELIKGKSMTYTIHCDASTAICESLYLGYEPYLDYSTYDVMIKFDNWLMVEKWVEEITVKVRSVSQQFSRYQLAVKYSFFGLSVLSAVCYLWQVLRMKVGAWSVETKGLVLLSVSLVLFNDPVFLATLIKPHVSFTVVSVVSVMQFVVLLAYFWANVMLNAQQTSHWKWLRRGLSLYLFVPFTQALFLLLTALYVYSAVQMKNDPSYRFEEFSPLFFYLAVFTIVMIAGYVLFLVLLTWRAIPELKKQTKRHKFLFSINLSMAAFTIACVCAGFFQRLPSIGAFVLIVISAYNIYIILLQVLYVPSEQGLLEFQRELELSNSVTNAQKWEEEKYSP